MGIGPLDRRGRAARRLIRLEARLRLLVELLPPLLVFSVGLSMIVAPLTATVLADADESDAGIASGVNNAVARVAGLLGIAVVGARVAGSANKLDLHGFRIAMCDHGGARRAQAASSGSRDQECHDECTPPRSSSTT